MTVAPSPHDVARMDDIITDQYGDWFSAYLLRLIFKADPANREKLRQVYPEHVKAVEDWITG